MKKFSLLCVSLCLAVLTFGKDAVPLAQDVAVEQRMIEISQDLRCLVCQNESLAGSHAELAEDLRREIRSMIKAGKTDDEIRDFLVTRYGDFVLYRPPFKATTLLLWVGPFLMVFGGLAGLLIYVRRRNAEGDAPLDEDAHRRARALIADANKRNES